jgi:hypothetical protein
VDEAAVRELDLADAAILRHAAWVLRRRAPKVTFALRVIIRVLERTADRIDGGEDHESAVDR